MKALRSEDVCVFVAIVSSFLSCSLAPPLPPPQLQVNHYLRVNSAVQLVGVLYLSSQRTAVSWTVSVTVSVTVGMLAVCVYVSALISVELISLMTNLV